MVSGLLSEKRLRIQEQGRSEDYREGVALSGAERQKVRPLVARVRRREAPPIEQWQGSGGTAPGGGLGAKPPTGC